MSELNFIPHVTAAAVIEKNGKFLLVKEVSHGQTVYNQPAGHWEANESLIDACVREAEEETAYRCEVKYLTGIYHYIAPQNGVTYLRFCFHAIALEKLDQPLDADIVEAVWLTLDEIKHLRNQLRSPLVLTCIEDYLSGVEIPLESLKNFSFPS